jgi:DNA repair protein RecN (Recombination protein N)
LLLQLSVENFAIFKNAVIELGKGLNIITGESGAGKSVLVNALSLVTGARAYKEMVRSDSAFAKVEAVFELTQGQKERIRQIIDFPDEDKLIITRQISQDQKSVCRINDRIRNLSSLSDVSAVLMDIHGQYENQSLLDEKKHLEYLDAFCGEEISQLMAAYNNDLAKYNEMTAFILSSSGGSEEREREKSLLEFQINEINESGIENEDMEELKSKKVILENSEKYRDILDDAISLLEGQDSSGVENIIKASKQVESVKNIKGIDQLPAQLSECYYSVKDVLQQLKSASESIEYNPYEYERVCDKVDFFNKLFRKYGKTREEVLKFRNDSQDRLYKLQNFEEINNSTLSDIAVYERNLKLTGEKITQVRKTKANILEKEILNELMQLEMKDACFSIIFTSLEGKNSLGFTDFREEGLETCEFHISTNKGMPAMPLKKIASGGEISRVMLSLKSVLSSKDHINTVIFDEIDSGISGQTAVKAGEKLKNLSINKQVICITHSAQIVAKGNSHYIIQKNTEKEETFGEIKKLESYEERVTELARLIDGNNISRQGIEHAKNILEIKE